VRYTQKNVELLLEIKERKYREEELEEAFKYIGMLPHAVRTWLLYYRDDELA